MKVYHIVLSDDDDDILNRWAKVNNISLEGFLQRMVESGLEQLNRDMWKLTEEEKR